MMEDSSLGQLSSIENHCNVFRFAEINLDHFSLKELETARDPMGLPIERDRHFEPNSRSTAKLKFCTVKQLV